MGLTTDENSECLNEKKANGQNECYLVLSEEELAKGFTRPFRDSYLHKGSDDNKGCGALTKMNKTISETYARDPKFYGMTFCVGCGTHLPVSEFVWDGTNELVGS